jgi:hypothetical protein
MDNILFAKINENTYINIKLTEKIHFPTNKNSIFYSLSSGECKCDTSTKENIQNLKEYLEKNSIKF